MRIIITGSSGVIASELLKLVNRHDLMLIDKKNGFDLSQIPMDEILSFEPDIIFHLAASFERTEETDSFLSVNYLDNLMATSRLNQAVIKMKNLKSYVYASSYLVYDPKLYLSKSPQQYQENCGLQEFYQISPRNLIGASKLYAEKEIRHVSKFMPNTRFPIARIFRGYGIGCNSFISRFIKARNNNEKVTVWNPDNKFDFIYAEDSARALFNLAFNGESTIYNVCGGRPTSVREVLSVVGVDYDVIESDEPYETSYGDLRKIESIWKPQISIYKGIEKIESYIRHS